MAETIVTRTPLTDILNTTEQNGVAFIRTTSEGTQITRALPASEAVQNAILVALNEIGITTKLPYDTDNSDSSHATQTVSVIEANTDGIPDRLQVEPPLSPEQVAQLGAKVGNLARLYAYTNEPEPTLVNPYTIEQASTVQKAA